VDFAGGGIWGVHGEIDRCIVTGNTCNSGGGIAKCNGLIQNTLVYGNTAVVHGSAINNCDGIIRNCTLIGGDVGQRALVSNCDGVFENTILGCTSGELFYQHTAVMQFCCYPGATGQTNCPDAPRFVDPNNGDYHLLADSPCINACDLNHIPADGETDLDGRPRQIGSAVDMGAYEFNHRPVADAGGDQTVYAWLDGWADVRLDGTGSADTEDHSLECFWYNDANERIATGMQTDMVLGVGEHTFHLVVSDGIDDSEPDTCTVTVVAARGTSAKMLPSAINTKSKRPRVLGRIEFAGPQQPKLDSDQAMLLLIDQVEVRALQQKLVYSEEDTAWYLFGMFDSAAVMSNLPAADQVEVTLVSCLNSGQWVYGMDAVKIK
jgi:hypothetical protein